VARLVQASGHCRSIGVRSTPCELQSTVLPIAELKVRFRALRTHHGLTQQKFAARVGLDYKFYQYLESPRKKQIWLETVDRIAGAYGMDVWELLHPDFLKFSDAGMRRSGKKSH
jgi:uncharacterized protein (DUF2342 family)